MELVEVQKEADSAGRKAVFFGAIALILAGFLGYLLAHLGGASAGDAQPVVVAGEAIPALTPLKREHLKIVNWPTSSLPTGYFSNPNDVLKTGQLLVSSLVAGEPILAARLSTQERGLGVAQLIDPRMRAFVVQVNDYLAKAQIIHPDEFVDVIATFTEPRTQNLWTHTILQNVKVLAVGDSVDVVAPTNQKDGATRDEQTTERHKVVTLLVSLADVEYLAFASREGKIDLALRSNMDSEIVTTDGVNAQDVMGRTQKSSSGPVIMAPSAKAAMPTTHVIKMHNPAHSAAHATSSMGAGIKIESPH